MNAIYQTDVTKLSESRQEPLWLREKRLSALQEMKNAPLPKLEKTDLKHWRFDDFQLKTDEKSATSLDELPTEMQDFISRETDSPFIVQQNATVIAKPEEMQQEGLIFSDLKTAIQQHEELVKPYLFKTLEQENNRLFAGHQALWNSGVFLYVPANLDVKVPLQSLFWVQGEKTGNFPHVLVVAEKNSRVELVANFTSDHEDQPSLSNAMVEVFVGQNANVRVATVNHMGSSVVDVIYRRAVVDRDGQLEWIIGDFSSGRMISDNHTILKGEGGLVDVKSVGMGAGEMRANITSTITHKARHTKSDIQTREVMKDKASSILNSITKIERGASKSDGQQSGKVLMLNPQARGDANPILLIDENDVTAGHAASVGQVDPMQVFYLMSRGISKEEAEKLIVFGFLDAVISEIPSESLQTRLHRIVEGKFSL